MHLVRNESARIVGLPIARLNKEKKVEFVSDVICLIPTIATQVDDLTWEHAKKDDIVKALLKKGELVELNAPAAQSVEEDESAAIAEELFAAGKK